MFQFGHLVSADWRRPINNVANKIAQSVDACVNSTFLHGDLHGKNLEE